MPTKEELLAHKKSLSEMSKHIYMGMGRLKVFKYQMGCTKALSGSERNSTFPQFSDPLLHW